MVMVNAASNCWTVQQQELILGQGQAAKGQPLKHVVKNRRIPVKRYDKMLEWFISIESLIVKFALGFEKATMGAQADIDDVRPLDRSIGQKSSCNQKMGRHGNVLKKEDAHIITLSKSVSKHGQARQT